MKHVIYGWLMLAVIAFTGCDAGVLNGGNSVDNREKIQLFSGDVAYKIKEGVYMIQGDILLTQQQVDDINSVGSRAAILEKYHWPNEKVYYTFYDNMSNALKENIRAAIRHIEEKTVFKFYERTNEPNYIEFYRGMGNSSYLGMAGGRQYLQLEYAAPVGTVIHEIGHALGLIHEQCRWDRDQYININYDNIREDYKHNFNISTLSHSVTDQFDFNSIMLYPAIIHDRNFVYDTTVPTLTKKDGSMWVRNNDTLSVLDQQKMGEIFGYKDRNFIMFDMDLDEYGEVYYNGPKGKVYEGEKVTFHVPATEMKKAGIEVYFSVGSWRKSIQVENGGSLIINQELINSLGLIWSDSNYSIQVRDCYTPPANCRVWVYAQHDNLSGGVPGKYFTVESNMGVEAEITCEIESADGTLTVTLPKGWDISPDSRTINLYSNIRKVSWKMGGVTVSSSYNKASYWLGPFGSGNFYVTRVYEFFDRTKDI